MWNMQIINYYPDPFSNFFAVKQLDHNRSELRLINLSRPYLITKKLESIVKYVSILRKCLYFLLQQQGFKQQICFKILELIKNKHFSFITLRKAHLKNPINLFNPFIDYLMILQFLLYYSEYQKSLFVFYKLKEAHHLNPCIIHQIFYRIFAIISIQQPYYALTILFIYKPCFYYRDRKNLYSILSIYFHLDYLQKCQNMRSTRRIFICMGGSDIFIKKFYNWNQIMHASVPMTGKKIQNYVFNYSDFLGNGNFSKCYKARNTKTNEEVAIKIVELNSLKSKKLQQLLFSEIEVLKQMNHPNVLRCFEVFTSNRNCYIITQLCNEGDLENKIKKKQKLDEVEIHAVIADVYKGLKYLASKSIIHRDLKIANIFMHNGVAKIADFGFAQHCKANFRDLNIGSPLYMSPQGILDNSYGPKTDVWAFGIMVYELYHGKTPFSYCQTEQELRNSVSRQIQWNQLSSQIPNEVKELILRCLEMREDLRPSIPQLATNQFLHRIVHNREIQTNTELKFKSPMKHKDSKFFEMHEEQLRGRSHMKMRSAFSTQDQSMLTSRPVQRVISPNKTYVTPNSHSNFNSINSSFNYQSSHNFFDSNQSSNRPNIAFNIPVPKIKQSVTMNDRSLQSLHTVVSPVTFGDETLNKTQSFLGNTTNSKKIYLITAQISFKECVSLLHYCRLLFKYLQCFKELTTLQDQSSKQHYAILAQFLIFCLEEIFEFVFAKKIKYDGENPEMREKKLCQVTEEYRSKYNKELDSQIIKRNLTERLKGELSLSTIIRIAANQSSILRVNEKSPLQQLIVGELLLVIYSSSLLLEQCSNKKNYSQFQKYKEIEQTLNRSKDNFTFNNYVKHRNRTFSSQILPF